MKMMHLIQLDCMYTQNEVKTNDWEVEGSQGGVYDRTKSLGPLFCPFNRRHVGSTAWDQIFPPVHKDKKTQNFRMLYLASHLSTKSS